MSRRARRRQPPPDLTSLFDVLFIVIFAALIRAAAVQSAAAAQVAPAAPAPRPAAPPVVLEVAQLHARAVTAVSSDVAERPTVVVRIAATGSVTAIERSTPTGAVDKTETIDSPLLEHSPDPDVALAYLGDRAAELRICRIAAVHLGAPDLAHHLVILAPEKPLADLPHALVEGLRRDVERCLHDQQGLAVIVEPTAADVPPPAGSATGSAVP